MQLAWNIWYKNIFDASIYFVWLQFPLKFLSFFKLWENNTKKNLNNRYTHSIGGMVAVAAMGN